MGGREADPGYSLYLVRLRQEVSEVHPPAGSGQVATVVIHVLAQQHGFTKSFSGESGQLREDGPGLPAPFPAADGGHDAVGAGVVAAVDDGDPGPHLPFPSDRQVLGRLAQVLQDLQDRLSGRQGGLEQGR